MPIVQQTPLFCWRSSLEALEGPDRHASPAGDFRHSRWRPVEGRREFAMAKPRPGIRARVEPGCDRLVIKSAWRDGYDAYRRGGIMKRMSENAADRARRRRATWCSGVAHGSEQALRADLAFWQQASPSERLTAVRRMVDEAWLMQGGHGPPPRLERSIGGVRRRARRGLRVCGRGR